jgi:hypothetical protein
MYYLLGYKYFNDFESIQKLYNNDDTNRVIESDDKTNNYGLETSKKNLIKKYIHYCELVVNKMEKLKFRPNSSIYEIIMLMNKRFL